MYAAGLTMISTVCYNMQLHIHRVPKSVLLFSEQLLSKLNRFLTLPAEYAAHGLRNSLSVCFIVRQPLQRYTTISLLHGLFYGIFPGAQFFGVLPSP